MLRGRSFAQFGLIHASHSLFGIGAVTGQEITGDVEHYNHQITNHKSQIPDTHYLLLLKQFKGENITLFLIYSSSSIVIYFSYNIYSVHNLFHQLH